MDISLADLPPFLREVAELTTLGTALTLARDYGGTRQYIPKRPAADRWLAAAVGMAAAQILARAYGDRHVDIPRFAARRRMAIAQAEGTGAEIARLYGVTERYVRMIRNASPSSDDRQGSLFSDCDQVDSK
ncbi:MAG: hypothetical protein MJA83_08485 [Gammaproteobacteria bacterium]|nr:hypothetical protein [Gammaproteobacteria bacterium]